MKYVAFLRGIGPGDPRKTNESLRNAFTKMGFDNVRSFISSGNILFESSKKDTSKLEKEIEEGLKNILELNSATFVKSKEELEAFIATKPFGNKEHSSQTYLTVTYTKTGEAVCNVYDNTLSNTPEFMIQLEKKYGKDITTRTYNTIQRVVAKL